MAKEENVKKVALDLLKGLNHSVIYIGNDKSYWGTIQSRIAKTSEELKFRYVHLTFLTKQTPEQLFLRIMRENPALIYIDFSASTEEVSKLAHYLNNETITNSVPRIGLIDNRALYNISISTGCQFVHFKGGEYHDVVYDPLEISYTDKIKQPEFATANFSMDSNLIDDMSVIYYTSTGAHIEGNVKLAIGQAVEITNHIPKERIPSKKYFIKKTGSQDIVTEAKYFYDVDFTFVDEPVFNNEELEKAKEIKNKNQRIQTIKLIKNDRQEQLDRYNERIEKSKEDQKIWVEKNSSEGDSTPIKILVVDFALSAFKGDILDDYDSNTYHVRFQTKLSDHMKEIFQARPSIIAFQSLEKESIDELIINMGEIELRKDPRALTEGEEDLKNEVHEEETRMGREVLASLVRRLKEVPNYKPFILLFNCSSHDSKGLQREFAYPKMMANPAELVFKNLLDMAQIYKKKQAELGKLELKKKADILIKTGKMKEVAVEDLIERRAYPSRSDSLSIMSYGVPITITLMTETELVFQTEAGLDLYQSFRLEHPLSMAITIVKSKNGEVVESVDGFNQYRALIHAVDEIDKKFIRQYVNEIIFSPVNEERDKEQSAFKELNEKFAKLKEEQLKERSEQEEKQKE